MESKIIPNKDQVNIFEFIKFSKTKEIITALKRTPRRDIYSNQEKIKIYHTLTDRNFIWNIENKKEITTFVNKTISNLNDDKRNNFFDKNGFLQWTLNEDGNTRDHTREQSKITKKYAGIDKEAWILSNSEYNILVITTNIHDIGESARWDVVYDNKNENNELFERKCGEVILDSILKEKYKSGQTYKYIQKAYNINFDKNESLQIFFKAYEVLSYLKWAMIATKNKEIDYPHRLVHNVLINQIKKLPSLRTNLPSVKVFIEEHKEDIDWLFNFVEKSDFFNKPMPNNKSKKEYLKSFLEAKAIRKNIR